MKIVTTLFLLLVFCSKIESQNKNKLLKPAYYKMDLQTLQEILEKTPSFGMFHENYFTSGIPLNNAINSNTADAKFQISISQRLFKSLLPFHTILALTYSQKSLWKVYANSSPFADNNYNPGFTLTKPVIKQEKLRGLFLLSAEHESNGRDSVSSRAWNYLTLSAIYFLNPRVSAQLKVWDGIVDPINNPDLLKYKGHCLMAINYKNSKDMIRVSAILNPRNGGMNTTLELNFRLSPKVNQFIFVQWYNGYAEDLINYNVFKSMLRIGICMKSSFWNYF